MPDFFTANRRPTPRTRRRPRRGVTFGLAGASLSVAGTLLLTGTAQAASGPDWNRLAQCESSGNWADNTGNGYFGGLQFNQVTWQTYGGTGYAARADEASPAVQQAIADRVLAVQGWSAWPQCSRTTGLDATPTGSSGTAVIAAAAPPPVVTASAASPRVVTASASSPETAADGDADDAPPAVSGPLYTIRAGDTLTAIARREGVSAGWQGLYRLNQARIGANPNLILAGRQLVLPGR